MRCRRCSTLLYSAKHNPLSLVAIQLKQAPMYTVVTVAGCFVGNETACRSKNLVSSGFLIRDALGKCLQATYIDSIPV